MATDETPVEFGKWYEEENHWVTLPDFISQRSFQTGKEDNNGWRFDRVKNYPNLWIRPEHSVVLTVSASEIVASDEYSAGITFRFPKAKRLRLDDDEKPASEVETEEGLYDLFNAYISKMQQSAARVSSSEFTIPSPSKMPPSGAPFVCRFLTAEQCRRKQETQKKSRKLVGRVQSLHAIQKESNALTGQKFHVIEGIYNFDKGSIDAEDAEREGWLEEATRIRSANDVRSFIKRHNGQVLRTPGMDTRLIGPSIIDNKVLHNIRGYDKLREKKDKDDKKKAKKGMDTEPVDSVPGVLKWTFLYSAVHRYLNERCAVRKQMRENDSETDASDEEDDDDEEDCIQLLRPQLLEPRFFDYMCQSEKYGEDQFESIWRSGELDATGMKRALTFLEDNTTGKKLTKCRNNSIEEESPTPWQYAAQQCLPVKDRWIMACEYEKLWPYTSDDGVNKKVAVVYPDLFGDDFGFRSQPSFEHSENRWNEIPPDVQMSAMASSLPLLRSMGCLVTCHLSVGVTHILCELTGGVDSVEWHPGAKLDVFVDVEHGRKLFDRLEEIATSRALLISRNWVLSKWDE